MNKIRLHPWRIFFLAGAAAILAGGPMHPGGTMAEMLADPDWVLGHSLVLAGFAALLAGLVLYARAGALPEGTRRWTRFAIIGTALQVVEMVFHTAAVVDHGNLVAGHSTPVLTTHLVMTPVLYPLFAATVIGLIVAAARERVLGSWWIAWIGILGVAAHGAAGLMVVGFGDLRFRLLFIGIAPFALWMLLAALWPARQPAAAPVPRPSPA